MDENRRKELLKVQQYALDCIPVYEMMESKVRDIRKKEMLRKIRDEKESHVRLLEKQTGTVLEAKQSDRRFMSGMRMIFGSKNAMNMMAQGEYDAAKDHEKILAGTPALKRIVSDERRHGDLLVRMKKMK